MIGLLGAFAAIAAWIGWLTVCPALGFPSLATGAMLNRVLVPRADPGFWLGWALLLIGLAAAALLYLAAIERGRLRPSIASGLVYGALCWVFAGAIVMPVLGLADPTASAVSGPPDPMRGSFMMLHLGVGAAIAALVAWLMFGALLGAISGRTKDRRVLRTLALGTAISIVAVVSIAVIVSRLGAQPSGPSVTATRTLATGPVQAMPEGALFVSVIELPQTPGAPLGPHAHIPGFAYSLSGVETLSFDDGRSIRLTPGEAGFMGTQEAHSHLNADDRVPTAALAFLLVVLTVLVVLISLRQVGRDGRLLPVALVLLITAGALGTWNPWSNDWLFLAIRPVAARGGAMPLPTASRTYESPDLGALPVGPYQETLEEITVAPGEMELDIETTGAAALLVLDGPVEVQPISGSSIQLNAKGATLLQLGASVSVANLGNRPVHVLKFSIIPAAPDG